jgi:hypothetical protein
LLFGFDDLIAAITALPAVAAPPNIFDGVDILIVSPENQSAWVFRNSAARLAAAEITPPTSSDMARLSSDGSTRKG